MKINFKYDNKEEFVKCLDEVLNLYMTLRTNMKGFDDTTNMKGFNDTKYYECIDSDDFFNTLHYYVEEIKSNTKTLFKCLDNFVSKYAKQYKSTEFGVVFTKFDNDIKEGTFYIFIDNSTNNSIRVTHEKMTINDLITMKNNL